MDTTAKLGRNAPGPATAASERSLRAALVEAISRFEAAAVPAAGLAAELLLMHVLGCDRAWLYAHPEKRLVASQQVLFDQLIAQRAAGMPTQYLTGYQEFWGLQFEVTPDVLIPRPETEHLIEVALERLASRGFESAAPLDIVDIGTGSGCLAVALACELPLARVLATDISPAAIEVARRNAARHGVRDRIEFVRANLLETRLASPVAGSTQFDLVVCNPPYVAAQDAASLPREVREYEPPQALFGGDDGLAFYPELIAQAGMLLRAGGFLVVELGHSQADRVRGMLNASAWRTIAVAPDLAGIGRVISAERSTWNVPLADPFV